MLTFTPTSKHISLFYHSNDELFEILVPYFRSGLESNEFCIWIAPDQSQVHEVKTAMRKAIKDFDHYIKKGQMEVGDYKGYYLKSGVFTAFEMLAYWAEKEKEILGKGFSRIRAAGNGEWALEEYWTSLSYYEEEVNKVIDESNAMAICAYPIHKLSINQIIHLGKNHQLSLVKQMGKWNEIEPDNFKASSIY